MTHHEDSDDDSNYEGKEKMDVDDLYPDRGLHYFSETINKENSPLTGKDIEANHGSPLNKSPSQNKNKTGNGNPSFATGVAEKFYDTTITGMGTGPLNSNTILRNRKNESFGIIGKREFASRFSQLTQLKQKAERAARR